MQFLCPSEGDGDFGQQGTTKPNVLPLVMGQYRCRAALVADTQPREVKPLSAGVHLDDG